MKETYVACFRSSMGWFGCCFTDTTEKEEVQKIADGYFSEGENDLILITSVNEIFSHIDEDEITRFILGYLHSIAVLRETERMHASRGIEMLLEKMFEAGVAAASELALKYCRP